MSALSILALISSTALACDDESDLFCLVQKSDVVVLARVDSRRDVAVERFSLRGLATLSVKETWVGEHVEKRTASFVSTLGSCNNRELYRAGHDVIAFLSVNGDEALGTIATRDVPEQDVAAIRDAVAHARELQISSRSPDEARNSWAMRAFAHPATRMDAARVLSRGVEPIAWLFHEEVEVAGLSSRELAALEDAFVNAPVADESLPHLMMLLQSRRSARLSKALAGAIDSWFGRGGYFPALLVDFYEVRVTGKRTRRDPDEFLLMYSGAKDPEKRVALRKRWEVLKTRR